MSTSSTSQLGRLIAGGINASRNIEENSIPDDLSQNLLLSPIDRIKVNTSISGRSYSFPSDSFVTDHLLYGDVDSSSLNINGSYDNSSLLAFYPLWLDNGDNSVNGKSSTSYNVTKYYDNKLLYSKSAFFNGYNSRIDITNTGTVISSHNVGSLSLWFYPLSVSNAGCLFSIKTSSGNDRAYLFFTSGTYELQWGVRDGGVWDVVYGDNPVTPNQWHFVVITSDGTTTKMYFDGELQSDTGNGDWFYDLLPPTGIELGRRVYTTDQWYNGLLSQFIIRSDVLTADDVAFLYNNGVGRKNFSVDYNTLFSYNS